MGTAGAEEAEVKSPIGQDFCFLAFKLLIQFYNTNKLDLLAEAKLKENNKKKNFSRGYRGLTYSTWLLNINNLDQGQ